MGRCRLRDEDDLAAFYEQRFRAEFQPAFRAWLATDPFEDPSAPPSPFAMEEYHWLRPQEANELSATAEASAELARTNIQRATNYVLGVVLFATSLFFAGISTKLYSTRLRGVILGVGCVVFVVGCLVDRHVPDQPVDLNGVGLAREDLLEPTARPPIRTR